MKIILYYISLLVLIALVAGYLIFGSGSSMSMGQMVGVSAGLVLYTVAMSFVGEGLRQDEREVLHRNMANRAGLIAGLIILSLGVIIQLFSHHIDYWLLSGLIAINVTKLVSLIYLNNNK